MLALLPLLALPELADMGAQGVEHASPAAHGTEAAHTAEAGHSEGGDDHANDDGHGASMSLVDGLPGWQAALVTLAAIAAVIVGGSVLTRPIFRFIALARLRELFTATALMMVIGIALLMTLVGLSPALGTFLAGVVLANSEYRHELESDIDPFKGLLLGLFFMTVGAGIDFGLLFADFGTVLGLTLGLMAIKAGVLMVLAMIFGIPSPDRWLFSLGLAQAGEFGFVLLSFTVAQNVIPTDLAATLLLVVALSMLLTPGLFILYDRVIAPRLSASQSGEADDIDEAGTVIIAGHGRFGGIVNRVLRGMGYKTVVLDYSSGQLNMLRAFGVKVFYGDASRPDLLHSAGISEAKLLVVAIDDREQATELVQWVRRDHPNVHIVARARDRFHVYELYQAGANDIIRETFDSSVRAARSAIEALGVHPYDAERQMRAFVRNDQQMIRELAQHYDPEIEAHENPEYLSRVKELRDREEGELRGMETPFASRSDRGWVPPTPEDVKAESDAANPQGK
jgi:CPA2 family monovalent cation:H+ antiporter-2